MKFFPGFFISLIVILFLFSETSAQNRINFNDRELFASGINVAWTRFDQDLSNPDLTLFREICEEIHENGGNSLRLWLHTTGQYTPQFDGNGYVTGPGASAIEKLQQILNIAWENEIGMMLCLWSHDMMNVEHSENLLNRNELFLTDTSATKAYINNALIPMVEAVKGHQGILAWEIFNEPEGFSEEFGWGNRRKVPESAIQRVVNLCAGAIHRTDSTALVTNGTLNMLAQTDTRNLAKQSPQSILDEMSEEQKTGIEKFYRARYGVNMTAEEIVYKFASAQTDNFNYYSDERLIAAGGDPDGKLDFYTVHYYSNHGTAVSPFHHNYDYWGLDKPLVIGEFFMHSQNSIDWQDRFELLYNTGYAGALPWQWWGDTRENDDAKNMNHDRTLTSLNYMWENYHEDVVVVPKTGTIYSFKADRTSVESGDSVIISWDTETGSVVTLNGESVPGNGSKSFLPDFTTTYTLVAEGVIRDTSSLVVEFIPSGRIFHFFIKPAELVPGDTARVIWSTSKGSEVYLNGEQVDFIDTLYVVPDEDNNSYSLDTVGDDPESREITVAFVSPEDANRALGADITVSSTDSSIPNNDPEKIIDGNLFSEWTSETSAGNQTVDLDLLRRYGIDHVKIHWGEMRARTYFLYGSEDAQNRTVLKHSLLETGEIDSIDTDGFIGRYLTLSMTPQNESTPISIKEIEVYNDPNISDVQEESIPGSYELSQNYPNPFNPSTIIQFSLPAREFVQLKVYDILGRKVASLVNEFKEAGNHEVIFESSSKKLASGIYIYQLQAGQYIQTRKMLLLK